MQNIVSNKRSSLLIKGLVFIFVFAYANLNGQTTTLADNQSSSTFGLLTIGNVVNPTLAIDSDKNTYSTLSVDAGVLNAGVQQTLFFPSTASPSDLLRIKLSSSNLLSVNALTTVTIVPMMGVIERPSISANSAIAGVLSNGEAVLELSPQATFDRVQVRLESSFAGVLTSINVHYAEIEQNVVSQICTSPTNAQGNSHFILGNLVDDPSNSVDGDINTYAQVNNPFLSTGVLTASWTQGGYCTGDKLKIIFSFNADLLEVLGSSSVLIRRNNATVQTIPISNGLIGLLAGSTDKQVFVFQPNEVFDEIKITNGAVIALGGGLRVYDICRESQYPPRVDPSQKYKLVCSGNNIVVNYQESYPGEAVRVYDEKVGGTLVYSGLNPIQISNITQDNIYYVYGEQSSCAANPYDSIIVDVITNEVPIFDSVLYFCANEEFKIVPKPYGAEFNFYQDFNKTILISTGTELNYSPVNNGSIFIGFSDNYTSTCATTSLHEVKLEKTSSEIYSDADLLKNTGVGQCNGSAKVTVTGGSSAYNIIWDNGELGTIADSLCKGIHYVDIYDQVFGCSSSDTIYVGDGDDICSYILATYGVSCENFSCGDFNVPQNLCDSICGELYFTDYKCEPNGTLCDSLKAVFGPNFDCDLACLFPSDSIDIKSETCIPECNGEVKYS